MDSSKKAVPAEEIVTDYSKISRSDFPPGFIFGTATSAYQVEGGAAKGGRGLSVWDAFTLRTPGKITDGSNGNEAVDMYTKYKEDIKMMKNMGFDAYRFSISWSRILPGGKLSLGVNREGVDFYNDVINTLLANGIEPYVTLFHWDLPFTLEQEYGGFLSKDVVNDFLDYAELCFWEFGDRVKYWITINEPTTYSIHGYVGCTFPPGKLDPNVRPNPLKSDSSDEDSDEDTNFTALTLISGFTRAQLPGYNFVPYRGFTGVETHLDLVKYGAPNEQTMTVMSNASDDPPNFVSDYVTNLAKDSYTVGRNLLFAHEASVESYRTRFKDQQKWIIASDDPPKFVSDYVTNLAKDSYTVGRNLLLAHAAAVESYRTKFKDQQKGIIGITLVTHWFEPYSDEQKDIDASTRALDFSLGWYLEPVLTGRYPQNMIDFVPKENLASFTDEESDLLKGSIDFLGLNYYTAYYVENDPKPDVTAGYNKDQQIRIHTHRKKDGKRIGPKSGAKWLSIVPWGIHKLLKYVDKTYNNDTYNLPDIYITENGVADLKNVKLTANEACRDKMRVKYYRDHLGNILQAMDYNKTDGEVKGVKVKGYFAWSWCDNFEWVDGYTYRFGMIYIDYVNHLKRFPKDSAIWFAKFLEKKKKLMEGGGKKQNV